LIHVLVAAVAVALIVLPILLTRIAPPVLTAVPNPGPFNGWVAFSAPGVGDQDIFIAREGQSARRIIGSEGDGLDQVCAVFSPDGSKLAYYESDRTGIEPGWYGGPTDVVIVEFDGSSDATELFRATATFRGCITWSPDSTQVAYVVENPEWGESENSFNQWRLQVATLDGEITSLFDDFQGHFGLEWSPDGSAIAVRVLRDNTFTGIWIVPVDGGPPRLLIRVSGCEIPPLTWSPDGSKIATRGGGEFDGYIRIVSIDGSNDYSIASSGPSDCDAVAWSPDGARLAYLDPTDGRIVLLNPDASDQVRLSAVTLPGETETPDIEGGPIWSPDGTSLLVSVTNRGDKAAIVSLSVNPQTPPVTLQYWDEGIANMGGLSWQPVYP
jgi:Tol biopolymer transport system component